MIVAPSTAKKVSLKKAIIDFSRAIKINKKDASSYYNRGISYTQKAELDKAIDDFTRAIEINPNFTTAYVNRGIAHVKNNSTIMLSMISPGP